MGNRDVTVVRQSGKSIGSSELTAGHRSPSIRQMPFLLRYCQDKIPFSAVSRERCGRHLYDYTSESFFRVHLEGRRYLNGFHKLTIRRSYGREFEEHPSYGEDSSCNNRILGFLLLPIERAKTFIAY